MKALVLHSPGDLRLEDVPEPRLKPGYVLLRVERVGICGTDKAFYKGTYRPGKLPLIPGHEILGEWLMLVRVLTSQLLAAEPQPRSTYTVGGAGTVEVG